MSLKFRQFIGLVAFAIIWLASLACAEPPPLEVRAGATIRAYFDLEDRELYDQQYLLYHPNLRNEVPYIIFASDRAVRREMYGPVKKLVKISIGTNKESVLPSARAIFLVEYASGTKQLFQFGLEAFTQDGPLLVTQLRSISKPSGISGKHWDPGTPTESYAEVLMDELQANRGNLNKLPDYFGAAGMKPHRVLPATRFKMIARSKLEELRERDGELWEAAVRKNPGLVVSESPLGRFSVSRAGGFYPCPDGSRGNFVELIWLQPEPGTRALSRTLIIIGTSTGEIYEVNSVLGKAFPEFMLLPAEDPGLRCKREIGKQE